MSADNREATFSVLIAITNDKCHNRRSIASKVVLSFSFEIPFILLTDALEPCSLQTMGGFVNHMKGRRRCVYKVNEIKCLTLMIEMVLVGG